MASDQSAIIFQPVDSLTHLPISHPTPHPNLTLSLSFHSHRQFNLIECFSNTAANPKNIDSSSAASDGSSTASRIAAVKTQLNSDNVKSLAETEQVQTLEILGEGTFGKVCKGLWRGTEVAVKTMILPSNMTGAEKREKMVSVREEEIPQRYPSCSAVQCDIPRVVQCSTIFLV